MVLSEKEEKILKSIVVASENNPNKPEFPADNPKFPATPTYKIKVPDFSDVWLKDESKNPTGTHKDRMAWEMVVTYRDFLLAKKSGQIKKPLPQLSIISFGPAAVAIQTQLKKYNLPRLKVLIDSSMVDSKAIESMKKLDCEIYQANLAKKPLNQTWEEILTLTHNHNGFDITSNEALDPTTRFYDWLSYEILNSSPNYCFIPFGTGNLYENILNINKKEVSTKNHDPRFKGKIEVLRRCNFMGVTSDNPTTKADKLYSPYLPFIHFSEQWIRVYRSAGFCGPLSDIYLIKENYLDKAMDIAKSQGINCEYSGIAGLALMLQMKNQLPKNKKMLIVNTGKTKYPL
ncbi:pyridoxal-phosphate dependent enzyme [Candidatus Micrarchaeota archaeon]|nr:pyridoxal-phosphate dependent enzyme [Candidatus Micrarchaeota archaeon]